MHHFVGMGDGGICDVLVLELNGVGLLFALGVPDVVVMYDNVWVT